MTKRVVITGMGLVSPIGNSLDEVEESLKGGRCGIDYISSFDTKDFIVKLGGEIKGLNIGDYISRKLEKRLDRVGVLGLIAGIKAVEDSGLDLENLDRDRVGVYVSTGIGGLGSIENQYKRGEDQGYEKLSPFFIPMAISNLVPGNISSFFNFHGSSLSPVTACAGSNTAIGEAYRNIKHGYSRVILAGGSEASITPLGIGGFSSMKALSTSQDRYRASIPFDRERDGFVMGEGSGILVLEDLDHALERGARIYAEVLGYGVTCDGNHITRPNEDGYYASRAMELALEDSGIDSGKIGYINAHGTSTPLNDRSETLAIKKAFPSDYKNIPVSSTKSMTGHLLGASGAVEAIISILAMKNSFIPPTINYKYPDEACDLNFVVNQPIYKEVNYSMSNSLGFGGHNTSILLGRWGKDGTKLK